MKQYIVDAFTDKVFCGNPAAVCVLSKWLSDDLMQDIALENNLSETAFAVKEGEKYHLRWFTPNGEIDLCGHATMATAYVITHWIQPEIDRVRFTTLSGELIVERMGELLAISFPAYAVKKTDVTDLMEEVLGIRPKEAYLDRDLLCVLENEEQVKTLTPDLSKALELDGLLLCVTAKGTEYDCVSRIFAPKCGISEDPVTGSAHCMIAPYWSEILGKNDLIAYQASKRGGVIHASVQKDRVILKGTSAHYATADLML